MMLMVALAQQGAVFVAFFAVGCLSSPAYGFLRRV
jgi:hypothetical protein